MVRGRGAVEDRLVDSPRRHVVAGVESDGMSQIQNQPTATPLPELERVQSLGKAAVFGVGLLYVVGLVILNLDLGRHGLVSLDLARPEYILVGSLWMFLTVLVWAATQV